MSIDNKFIKGARRFSTTLAVPGVADASTATIPLTIIPAVFSDGDPIELIVDRVATTGALTTGNEETIVGIVSGSNVVTSDRGVEGTAQAHAAGAVVEIKLTSDMWNRLVEGILLEHNEYGQHKIDKLDAIRYGADAGSSDAYEITLDPAPEAYYAGMRVGFKANTANTAGATLNVNGLGAKTIKKLHDQTLADGDIEVGQVVCVIYDGTDFQMQSQIANDPATVIKATAQEVVTGTDNAKYATPLALVPLSFQSLFAQSLINGNFDVWQRGTSVAFTTTNGYAADGWLIDSATAGDDKTVSRQTAGIDGSQYSMRVQRNSGETGHTVLRASQALETQDSIKFRGKKVTFSFYLKVGANFSAASGILTAKIVTGKGTDQQLPSFTTSADAVSSDLTPTTSFVKYTITTSAVIASDVTQIGVSLSFDPVGTASTNDWFEVSQAQLCAGDVALPFLPRSYDEELEKCFRYLWAPDEANVSTDIAQGQAYSTTGALILFRFPRRMRIAPNLTATASDWKLNDPSTAAYDVTSMAIDGTNTAKTKENASVAVGVASGLTSNRPYLFRSDGGGTRLMYFSAEM